jgi:hypothetical protein
MKLEKTQVLAVMGMYSIYKGSPIGLAKNVCDSIKVGRWKYGACGSGSRMSRSF